MSVNKRIDVISLEVPSQSYPILAALTMIQPHAMVLNSLSQSIHTKLNARQIICRQRKRGKGLEVVGEFGTYLLELRMQNKGRARQSAISVRVLRDNERYDLTAALDAEITEALAFRTYVACAETYTTLVRTLSDATRIKLFGPPPISQKNLQSCPDCLAGIFASGSSRHNPLVCGQKSSA